MDMNSPAEPLRYKTFNRQRPQRAVELSIEQAEAQNKANMHGSQYSVATAKVEAPSASRSSITNVNTNSFWMPRKSDLRAPEGAFDIVSYSIHGTVAKRAKTGHSVSIEFPDYKEFHTRFGCQQDPALPDRTASSMLPANTLSNRNSQTSTFCDHFL